MGKFPRYGVPIAEAIARYDTLAAHYPIVARFEASPPPRWLMHRCLIYSEERDGEDASFPVARHCVKRSLDRLGSVIELLMTGWIDRDILTLWRHRDQYMLGPDTLVYDTEIAPHGRLERDAVDLLAEGRSTDAGDGRIEQEHYELPRLIGGDSL
jgi:hypothetical protein